MEENQQTQDQAAVAAGVIKTAIKDSIRELADELQLGETSAPRVESLWEKTWDELTDAERIQRLREEMQTLQSHASYASECANAAREIAADHRHAADGTVLVPAPKYYGGNQVAACQRNPLA